MAFIEAVGAREILDSRGNPTVEVEVLLDDGIVAARRRPLRAPPPAPSRRTSCATATRSATTARACSRPSTRCSTCSARPSKASTPPTSASSTPTLIEPTAPTTSSALGANAILGVSLAVAKAAADSADLPLFRYLGGPNAHVLPVPMLNVINGGAHADNGVDIQEFMVAADRRRDLRRGAALGRRDLPRAQERAEGKGLTTGLGDEGGFAPDLPSNRERLDFLVEAIEKAGFTPGTTSRSAWTSPRPSSSTTARTRFEGKQLDGRPSSPPTTSSWSTTTRSSSIEDALAEDDWDGWKHLTERARRQGAARRRRPVRHQPGAPGKGIEPRRRPTRSWSRSTRSAP